jgi:pimeloyl-ACP methyl ester carboxylesterase
MAEPAHPATGYQERDVRVRGTSVRLLESGSGSPLLYLHHAGDPGLWTPALAALAGHYAVCRPDHPGFGASEDIGHVDSVHELAFFYLDLLDELGHEQVVLAGSSFGGWLAADLAAIEPGRVSRLVLAGPAGLRAAAPVPDIFLLSPPELAELSFHTSAARSAALEQAATLADDPARHQRYLRDRGACAHLAWNPYLHDPKLEHRLHRITAPALILWGAQDRIFPVSHARRWAELLPGARLAVIDEAGHLPLAEQPDAAAQAILTFCAEG